MALRGFALCRNWWDSGAVIFKGGEVADQIVGFVPQDVIEEKVKRCWRWAPLLRGKYLSIKASGWEPWKGAGLTT